MNYLTSLRGLAAFLVVFYHVSHHLKYYIGGVAFDVIANGYLAVDFFFVLSGYILAYKYHGNFEKINWVTYQGFIAKRIARIYPLHLFVLLCFVADPLAHILTGRPVDLVRFSVEGFVSKLFLVDSWWLGYHFTWNVPSWSISAEFFSYLLFPLLAYLACRMTHRAIFVCGFVCVFLIAFIFHQFQFDNIGAGIGELAVIRCLFEFIIGMVGYITISKGRIIIGNQALTLFVLSVFSFVMLSFSKIANYFYAPILFAAVIVSLPGFYGAIHRVLENRYLVYLGEISYSIYMVHYFIRDMLTMLFLDNDEVASPAWLLTYVAITLGFSMFTYHFIEVRARKKITGLVVRAFA